MKERIEKFLELKSKEINRIAEKYPEEKSLWIEYSEFARYDHEFAEELITNFDEVINIFDSLLTGKIRGSLPEAVEEPRFHARFYNLPKERGYTVIVRDITAEYISRFISVEGLVNKISDVLPKVLIGRFYCSKCNDPHDEPQATRFLREPLQCKNCRKREFRFSPEDSIWTDMQKIEIQEPLEMLKGGEQARRIEIWLEDDLVDLVTAGDKVIVTGVVRLLPPKFKGPVYFKFIEANSIEGIEKEFEDIVITPEEENEIKKLSKDPNIRRKVINSIAPSIYGYNEVKEAVALQLFGGRPHKKLPDGTVVRPDIHLLLVGDPGVAKSRILQYVTQIAPKSIYVTGKGTTGAGLCVDGNSLIFNSGSLKTIGKTIDENFSEEFSKEELPGVYSNTFNLKTYTLDKNLRCHKTETSKIWKIKSPKNMIGISTQSGKELILTQNTPLMSIRNGRIKWIKSSEIGRGDYVATVRHIPLNKKEIPLVSILKNKKIRIKDNVSEVFCKITNKLLGKYKELQKIAEHYNIKRDRIYTWRSKKCYQSIPLHIFMEIGKNAGLTERELVRGVKRVFLRYGTYIKIPELLNDSRIGYFSGLIAGDGSIYEKNGRAMVRFFNSNEETLNIVKSLAKELFGISAVTVREKNKVPYIRINSRIVAETLNAIGLKSGEKSPYLDISDVATSLGEEFISNFIKGLFETDGWVYIRKKGSSGIGFLTSSQKLAQKIQLLLLGFGIRSRVRKRQRKGDLSIIRGRKVTTKYDQFQLEIYEKEGLVKFREKVGFTNREKSMKLNFLIEKTSKSNTNVDILPEISDVLASIKNRYQISEKIIPALYVKGERNPSREKLKGMLSGLPNTEDVNFLMNLANSDIRWEKVNDKRILNGNGFVYDFTVPEHNFLVNGFFVHNTATAERDEFAEGAWTLKAGALVLAGGGIVAIDEFDKMDKEDRSAMHEAMEQQTISVAKAGIVTKFKANTSVLAASNPKFSRFDNYKPLVEQFDIPATLISRFDLIFPIRDVLDKERDMQIAEHMLKMHKTGEDMKGLEPEIPTELFRKYIAYSRKNTNPILTDEAAEKIKDFYVNLRGMSKDTITATPRQLEALVRLAEASSKMRLNDKVTLSDVDRAIELTNFVLRAIAYDQATGEIDIDRVVTEHSKSTRERIRIIEEIIQNIIGSSDEGLASFDDIISNAQSRDIDKFPAEQILNELKIKGVIYEPRHGWYKFAR